VLIPNLPYAEHDSLPTVVTELPPDNGRTALDVTSHLIIQCFQYLRKVSEDVIDLNCRDPTLRRDILRLGPFDALSIHFFYDRRFRRIRLDNDVNLRMLAVGVNSIGGGHMHRVIFVRRE
jgi:hypothetical protein